MIYFDSSATTKPNEELLNLHKKISLTYWYNSETLYHEGVKSKVLFEKAQSEVNNALNTNKLVLFTSGATEANNLAIFGVCNNYLNEPKHLITTVLEHASVLKSFKALEKRGFSVTYLKPNKDGVISLEDLKNALRPTTVLVSIMWVNNILGSIQPIKEIIEILKAYPRCRLHVDGVQGIGKLTPDFKLDDIDYFTISGHKLHGIKGTGVLLTNPKYPLSFMYGGHQQASIRPGTIDLSGAVVMAKTIKLACQNTSSVYNNVMSKYKMLIEALNDCNHLFIHTSPKSSPYILSITFKNLKGETALHHLEQKNIIVGTGSACNSNSDEQELSLVYTLDKSLNPINTIRISLDESNTDEEINYLIKCLKEIGK